MSSEANEDNLLGDDLGEYDLLNEDEEALLADDYREEQREYEDVLDIGVTEDGLEDDLDNETCDVGGSLLKGDRNNSSYLEINASNTEDFDSSQNQSPGGAVNKLETENNEQIDEEDEDEEAEREARERFRSERKSSTNPATFRNIPDSLDKVVSNPLPAARQNSQRPGRGGWRMRGNNRGAINRLGQPRMARGGGRGFIHQRHPPYMPNRFQQPGSFASQHYSSRPRGMWFPPPEQQPPLRTMGPPPRLPPPSHNQPPFQVQHHQPPLQVQQHIQSSMNNQTSRKILINPHFRGAVQPHPNARLVWDNGVAAPSNSEQPQSSSSSLLSIPPSAGDSNIPVNIQQHHHYNQQHPHISSHSQQTGIPMYDTHPGPQQQQQSYPNYHTQGSISHHPHDNPNFQQHQRINLPNNLQQQRVPHVNSGNWLPKPLNDSGYAGQINTLEHPQHHQQINQPNQPHYYNDGQNTGSDMCDSTPWTTQRSNVQNPTLGTFTNGPPQSVSQYSHHSISTSTPGRQVWQYDDSTLFGPDSDSVYDSYSSSEVMFSSDVSVENPLPVSSTTLLNEQPAPLHIYPPQTQHPQQLQRHNIRPPGINYTHSPGPRFTSQGPGRKTNTNLNSSIQQQRVVVYQKPQPTEMIHQQQRRQPQQIRPQVKHQNMLPSNINTNINNNTRKIIQTKSIVRKQVPVHSTQQQQSQQQKQRININSPIKRSLISGEIAPRISPQKRIKMRQGDVHATNLFITKRKSDMSNLHEVKTVDTLTLTTPHPDTTTFAPGDDTEQEKYQNENVQNRELMVKEEDEEAIEYRQKIEQQKKLREQFLQQKEARRKKAALEKQKQLGLIQTSISTTAAITSTATTTTPPSNSDHIQGNAIATIVNRNTIEPSVSSAANSSNSLIHLPLNKPKRTIYTKTPLLKTPPNFASGTVSTNLRPNRTVVLRGTSSNSTTNNTLVESSPTKAAQNRLVKSTNVSSIPTRTVIPTDISKTVGTTNTSSIVAIENLAASTSELQLRQMCQSVGHIKELRMIPQERRALVTFTTPTSANNFFKRYQRKIVDLSLINLTLVS